MPPKFKYTANEDSCEVCTAMEGYYDEEPARPHPNCLCSIWDVDDETLQRLKDKCCMPDPAFKGVTFVGDEVRIYTELAINCGGRRLVHPPDSFYTVELMRYILDPAGSIAEAIMAAWWLSEDLCKDRYCCPIC